MDYIAIIPARGGSKRIPRKNIKEFYGKPIISYAIETAISSGIFSDVFVTTDDPMIQEVAMKYGALVPWLRSESLSGDYTTTADVMQDATIKLEHLYKSELNICCIYPTVPLLKKEYIVEGARQLGLGKWNYVFSAVKNDIYPERFFSLSDGQGIQMHMSGNELSRTQEFSATYHDAGQFYWAPKASWKLKAPIFSENSTIVEIPASNAVDINTLSDWEYAEYLFSRNGCL